MSRGLCLLLVCLAAVVARTAAQAPARDELTISPYLIVDRGDTPSRIERRERLGAAAEKAGDFARAVRHYTLGCHGRAVMTGPGAFKEPLCEHARQLLSEHPVLDAEIEMRVSEGQVQLWTFNFRGAVRSLRETIAKGAQLNPDLPDSTPINSAHLNLGTVLIELGEFDEAQRELTFSRDHCRTSGVTGCVAYSEIALCRLHTMLGNFGPARAACDSARTIAIAAGDQLMFAHLEWMQGTLEAALGRHAAALTALHKAWQDAQMRGAEFLQPIIAQLIIDSSIRTGQVAEAERWQAGLDQGLKEGKIPFFFGPQIAIRRAQIAMARYKFDDARLGFAAASRSLIHEMSIRGLYGMALVDRLRGDLAGARGAYETAIGKIETSRTNTSGSALRASYLTMHSQAYRELIGVRWDADGPRAAADALQIAEKSRARALLDQLASAQVTGASAPTLDALAVQKTLAPDQVLVEYVSTDQRAFAITVTRERIQFKQLESAGSLPELERRIDFFADLAQTGDEQSLAPAAMRLYADVLAPALDGVPSTARTLLIAADGPLHRLPFDAIGDGTPVLDRWDVVTLPSASTLAHRADRPAPTAAALVVAAPADDNGQITLAAAPAEAAAIRRRIGGSIAELTGTRATQSQLEAQGLGRFAVVHFASHARVDDSHPLQSALLLAPGAAGADRQWTAEEIYRTPINADLVVLSACSTAAGAETPGEGAMSLSRAFLYAGAGATVATLWDVLDAPGPVFADELYGGLAAGRPLGAAVAEARRELRRRGAPPRAWAAYVVTGDPSAIVRVKAPAFRRDLAARAAAMLAFSFLVAAIAIKASMSRPRVRWFAPVAATVSVILVAAALFWPVNPARLDDDGSGPRRSARDSELVASANGGQVTWQPLKGADEYVVQLFDEAGMPVSSKTATSPFEVADKKAAWARIEARDHGRQIARSLPQRLR